MHDLGGIPYDEIATLTTVSLGTVKSRISRGRRRLAELLEPSYRPETSKDQ
jgi:RNA polymerase sigma-70 factor (ECF subfamily)